MEYTPHKYQDKATGFILSHPYCALFMDMGLGKTVSTLTAVERMMYETIEVERVLVVAPKSVALNTWSNEAEKWDHLKGLRLSIVIGTEAQRRSALASSADIFVTNRDNIAWLVSLYSDDYSKWPFDCVVLDESSSFKNFQSKRFKALWKIRPYVKRIIELTGTPAPNGLIDLWAQVKLLDAGERLGRFIGQYREAYFRPGARSGAVVYDWKPKPGSKELIAEKLSDICLSMKAEDYLDMPEVIDAGLDLVLDKAEDYKKFEKDCIMNLDGTDIMAVTAVALTNKLLQYASGAVYDGEHSWHTVSDTKIQALDDLIEQAAEPLLIYYNFQHERERILKSHPEAVCFKGEPEILERWNAGQIPVLLCHPASVAYGLNMQQGGHIIIWYSPTWNLELYLQANARLNRQGQTKPVIIYHLTCKSTVDEIVMQALRNKSDIQKELLKHIKQLTLNPIKDE